MFIQQQSERLVTGWLVAFSQIASSALEEWASSQLRVRYGTGSVESGDGRARISVTRRRTRGSAGWEPPPGGASRSTATSPGRASLRPDARRPPCCPQRDPGRRSALSRVWHWLGRGRRWVLKTQRSAVSGAAGWTTLSATSPAPGCRAPPALNSGS